MIQGVMAPPGTIGNREREILTAIVETFIATGEPVGSRMLSRSNREGLSPATIRNVMADLSDAGFLEQPHTSAGRVPTTEAYRYYVEQISGKRNYRLATRASFTTRWPERPTCGIHGTHLARAVADFAAMLGGSRGERVRRMRWSTCIFRGWGSESAGGRGDEVWPGPGPGVAARPSAT